ncbi:Nif-specific regulatory protein [Tetrabaena socialis]|uniref:Nif-specific regulatory protein n=1 Tax=Tetrabaena socialis TaxID=47790 RepID=A0A2J7ZLP1_9CHLO|nr:Nif-specific regulatory protein [Tetrabaena socialis]|eukprot:PNH01184.1 Nif-specific regulatory protein [Tetrabaena socialis]
MADVHGARAGRSLLPAPARSGLLRGSFFGKADLRGQRIEGPRLPAPSAAGVGTLDGIPDPDAGEQAVALLRQLEKAEDDAELARRRARALAPFLVTAPKQGIVGSSKYADRLRKQVVEAARDAGRRVAARSWLRELKGEGNNLGRSATNLGPRAHGKPVLVFGEPGLQKSNVAALVHFGGRSRATPMAALDCSRMDSAGSELFGRGDRAGLVESLGDGTLLLKNLPPGLLPKLIRLCGEGTYRRATDAAEVAAAAAAAAAAGGPGALTSVDMPPDSVPPLRRARCRIIMTASRQVPQLDRVVNTIKVPPLRLRPADVKDLQRFYLAQAARQAGSGDATPRLAITPAALRQLESYGWPGNITEVAVVVERAVQQAGDAATQKGVRLTEEVFWFAKQAKDRFRLSLLAAYPPLRQLLRTSLWPDAINFKLTAYVYPLVVALLLWGPQVLRSDRLHNPMLTVFWDGWWPLVFVSFPLLGRVWCAVCPFMIYGELMQRWRTTTEMGLSWGPLRKWPRDSAERVGPAFLFSLFAAILVWEEVWDLPNSAALSGWLLIIITAGAVVFSSLFERRLWCRYLCPIGGMTGMFAKLAITEVRAKQGVCSGECTTYNCYKGGPATPPEGLESPGCPLYSHPAQLTDNRNCTMCMECLRACPNSSVDVRLRLPGADLWSGHTTSAAEVSLMFMLLGAVYLHSLPSLAAQLGLDPAALGLVGVTPQHMAVSVVVLAAPGLLAWGADAAGRSAALSAAAGASSYTSAGTGAGAEAVGGVTGLFAELASRLQAPEWGRTGAGGGSGGGAPPSATAVAAPFLSLSYGYMPLVWAATLGHYLRPLLAEGGRLLPISAAMVGWEDAQLPVAVADPAVITFLQGSLLLFGAGASAVLSRKLAAAPWRTFVPQLATISLLTVELWALILPH